MKTCRIYMKGIVSALAVVALAMVGGCSDDDNDAPTVKDNSVLQGIWCSVNESGNATVLELSRSHRIDGMIYYSGEEGNKTETFSGAWSYYANNDILVMDVLYATSLQSHTTSYKVNKADGKELALTNQDLNERTTYYRLESELSLASGESYSEWQGDIQSVVSSNSNVVEVGADHIVVAKDPGVAFLLVSIGSSTGYIKINVVGLEDIYISQVMGGIQDVLEASGKPDIEGAIGNNMGMVYNKNLPEGYAAVQYQYDPATQEVTRILVQYSDRQTWQKTVNYLSANLNREDDNYFPGKEMMESPYFVNAWESNGKYYVSYNNLTYFIMHGYFRNSEAGMIR